MRRDIMRMVRGAVRGEGGKKGRPADPENLIRDCAAPLSKQTCHASDLFHSHQTNRKAMADINAVAQQFTNFYYQTFDSNRSSLGPLYVRFFSLPRFWASRVFVGSDVDLLMADLAPPTHFSATHRCLHSRDRLSKVWAQSSRS
jgi:hypothetical protein